jgi:hypothetical protein
MEERSWKRLLDKIREGNVVPIIGPRLLVGADGKTSLLAQIAQSLLQGSAIDVGDMPLPPFREMNEAVSRLMLKVEGDELYDLVNDAIRATIDADDFAVPEPIRQLAQIADFRLIVTLTPDELLARSLRQRCEVNEIVHSPNLPTSEAKDLARDWQTRSGQVQLLYLFGKTRSAPMFAIHDEDVLEYAHNVIAHGSNVPSGFFGELQQRNLLLVGCNFPDWLSRFFLRAANQKRLSKNEKRAWIIEPLQPEESLTVFLQSYSKQTEILSGISPVEFVAELHRHWLADHATRPAAPNQRADLAMPRGTMFFISYSRNTDLPRAETLYQALIKQGVAASEVWFDRKAIEPGDDFRQRILDAIHTCRYFLPLLSEAANNREEAFVFEEWVAASKRDPATNRDFLLPIIVDTEYKPETYTTSKRGRLWAGLDFGHAPEGLPNSRLMEKFKDLVRDARRRSAQ